MNDRELLELAAKAIGTVFVPGESWDDGAGWNPLTDDGDAQRLAVKLRLEVAPCDGCCIVSDGVPPTIYIREDGSDEYAATRRAITRAAAAIGEQKCRT